MQGQSALLAGELDGEVVVLAVCRTLGIEADAHGGVAVFNDLREFGRQIAARRMVRPPVASPPAGLSAGWDAYPGASRR